MLEFAVPVWNGALTLEDSNNIEQIQKRAFKIILQDQYSNYENSCQYFNTEKLVVRREKICLTYARKELDKQNSVSKRFHPKFPSRANNKKIVEEFQCLTNQLYSSSLPYLARLINTHIL